MGSLTIGIDFRPALSRATGVGRYVEGLVSGLQRIDRDNTYVLFASSLKERLPSASRPPNFLVTDRHIPVRILNALWHRVGAPSLDLLTGRLFDVVHSPTPLLLPSRHARSIVTIHDLFFLEQPDATEREIRRDYARLVRSHAKRADAVITVSETTAADVESRLSIPRERIHVVHHGVDDRFKDRGPSGTNANEDASATKYLLAVATLEPRKNLPTLLEAISLLIRRGWGGRLKIAGGNGVDTERVHRTIERLGLSDVVERLGYVGAAELPALYRRARALVMPSLWEGFGMPLLEAMASGVPIVASDIPVHREIAVDAAAYAPVDHPEALADAIERVWGDEKLRSCLVKAGLSRVSAFSWEDSARKTLAVYRGVTVS
jgi:glycosyltransferase involved in cell wall biosynthesis